jgi:hypothetical protein
VALSVARRSKEILLTMTLTSNRTRSGPTHRFAGALSVAAMLGLVGVVSVASAGVASASSSPYGTVAPYSRAANGSTITLTGWAIDPTTTDSIDVHAYLDGAFVSASSADITNADVLAAHPAAGANHGFAVTMPAPTAAGKHFACVYAIGAALDGNNPLIGCRTVVITTAQAAALTTPVTGKSASEAPVAATSSSLPGGFLDGVIPSADGTMWTVWGWSIDLTTPTTPVTVNVLVDGTQVTSASATLTRDDVAAKYTAAGAAHGFQLDIAAPIAAGTHHVCVSGADTTSGVTAAIGCRKVVVPAVPAVPTAEALAAAALPRGIVDPLTGSDADGTWTVTGWAVDPTTPTAAVTVHVYIDGAFAAAGSADLARSDVATALPTFGADHGFAVTVPRATTVGTHYVCALAINSDAAGTNPLLGCRMVTV